MDNRQIQQLLRSAGYYDGDIDGDLGPLSNMAVNKVIAGHRDELPVGHRSWGDIRKAVAAGQLILKYAGYTQGGNIDGHTGPDTQYALTLWNNHVHKGEEQEVFRDDEETLAEAPRGASSPWPSQKQSELVKFFGYPGGAQCTAGKVELPFKMKIAWNTKHRIDRFSCHEAVAESATQCYRRIASAYSPEDITRLGFDLFGGCYNFRKKRGGSTMSTHSWGIAIDTDPQRNQLKWGRDRANLASSDCHEFFRIWEDAGWTSLGRARNYDWMHVQAAGL